ncbi:MAG: DUF2088 domain-containing protein, partial [Planctomycetia bacterium]|nr:DUF2088 domain-containing protein [Planctomycetia bacterium]
MNIDLDYAAAGPLALAETLSQPLSGPPLRQHVVPGDRVVIALPPRLPGDTTTLDLVVQGLTESLAAGGVDPSDITVLVAPPLELLGPKETADGKTVALPAAAAQLIWFQPESDDQTAYLLADAEGEPLHLARQLVDADVVVAVETFSHDPALGGRSPAGELWPGFARQDRRLTLARSLLENRRPVLEAWKRLASAVTDQLGLLASLRLVPGRDHTLAGVAFGFPADATRHSRRLAQVWRPAIGQLAALTIAGISDPGCTLATLTRAVAAAAKATRPDGTICVACN